ncbi:MAG: LamG-like jellyroll fold domain-containing protein, partial [Limisphaerales bacterium]
MNTYPNSMTRLYSTLLNRVCKITLLPIIILLGAILAPSSASAQTPTLMMNFGFEDTGVTTTDSVSGVVLNMTNAAGAAADLHGAVGTGVAGLGKALDFTSGTAGNGSNPLADVIGSSAINFGTVSSFTVTMWIKPTGTTINYARLFNLAANGITDNGQANTFGFQGNGNIGTSFQTTVNTVNHSIGGFSPSLAQNVWTFVAYTYDGVNTTIYTGNETTPVNSGVSVANAGGSVNIGSSFSMWIGNRPGNGRGTPAYYDDVRVYTGAADTNFLENVRQSAVTAPDPYAGATIILPSATVYAGSAVTLSAQALGTQPISYFWQTDGGSGGVNWTDLSGSTTNTYTLDTTSLSGANQYRLVVTNALGSYTGATATLTVLPASGPVLVTDTTILPSPVAAGNSTTLSASFAGTLPIYYQWQYAFDTNGNELVDIPGATNAILTFTNAQFSDAGAYRLVVSNSFAGGSVSNSSFAALVVTVPVTLTDFGTGNPDVGPDDIAQLSNSGEVGSPDSLNYYTDNGNPPGQTFMTGTNANGYAINSIYIQCGIINGGHSAGNPWTLRLYSVDTNAGSATLIGAYQNDNVAPAFGSDGHWQKWTGNLTNILSPDTVYAYSVR